MATPHFLAPLLRGDSSALTLRNERNDRIIAATIRTAFDSRSRRRGLLGSDELPHSTALVIAPCNAIHTCFMRFAIDVIFADRMGRVVSVAQTVAPWRIR